jgi:hypothetical protein
MMVIYIRFIIFDLSIEPPSDEHLYVTLARDISDGRNIPVSGPGFLYLIQFFSNVSGLSFEISSAIFGSIVGSLFLIIPFFIYRNEIGIGEKAVQVCMILICTSYLIWPMIESRPQQIGMVLVMMGSISFYWSQKADKFPYLFILISLITFFYHILSFLILIGMVLIYWWLNYIGSRTSIKRSIPPVSVLILGGIFFVLPNFIYTEMMSGVEWMFETSKFPILWKFPFFPFHLLLLLAIIPIVTHLMKINDIVKILRNTAEKYAAQITIAVLVITGIGLIVQFILNSEVYLEKYRDSFWLFIVFQIGNLAFGLLFLKGYSNMMKKGEFSNVFFQFASILMLLGAIVLCISIFLPLNFNNWLIRIINYWALFGAPIALNAVESFSPRWRKIVILILPVLIVLSLVNISRDQSLFGYP